MNDILIRVFCVGCLVFGLYKFFFLFHFLVEMFVIRGKKKLAPTICLHSVKNVQIKMIVTKSSNTIIPKVHEHFRYGLRALRMCMCVYEEKTKHAMNYST